MRPVVALTLVFLFAALSLSAATFEAPSDAQLLDRAQLVVVATVVDSASREAADRMIFTDTRLRVERIVKGSLDGDTVVVSELGGFANGHGIAVPGAASYASGTRVLAFLRQRDDGSYFTAYMGLGKYRFTPGDRFVVRDEDGLEVDSHDAFAARPAEEFIEYLRAGAPVTANRPALVGRGVVEAQGIVPRDPVTNAAAADFVLVDNGKPLRWDCPSACTKSWTSSGPQMGTVDTPEALNDSMAAWTNEPSAWITLQHSGFNAQTASDNDDINDIVFNSSDSTGICDSGLGCGIIYYNGPGFEHTFDGATFYDIISSDVVVRPVNFTTQNAFEAVLAHELGHAIGFKHAPSSGALMSGTVPSGATLRTYDVEAVAEVYGNGLPCVAPGSASISGGGTVPSGSTKTLTANHGGNGTFTYQWYEGASGVTTTPVGTNNKQFTTPPINGPKTYWVRVTNGCGTADSPAVTVQPTGCTQPSIATQPASQQIASGSTATLSVAASGTSPFNYQWYQGTTGVTTTPVGTNSPNFTTPALTSNTSYWVRVSNSCGEANSNTANITVGASCAPSITTQPASQQITSGSTATLTVAATGSALTYAWFQGATGNTTTPVGTNSPSFTTPALTSTTSYWVRVSNNCGEANSNAATVTVTSACVAPAITSFPESASVQIGNGVSVNASVTGTAPLSAQWYLGQPLDTTNPIPGATGTSIGLGPFSAPGTYRYWLRVTNACGTANSPTLVVTVGCVPLVTPTIFVPAAAHFSTGHDVQWTGDTIGILRYELQESTSADFTANLKTFTVTTGMKHRIDPKPELTADTRFYYRVRAVASCNFAPTPYSQTSTTVVTAPLPANSSEFAISVPESSAGLIVQDYLVPGFGETATNGDTFAIATDVPWLTVFPQSGALSAGGTTVQFTINTGLLSVGSTTGTVFVTRTQPSAGRAGTNGTSSTTLPFSISKVTPVTPAPRSTTPPPGTLLIPAIAHADGIGTRFQSDVRIVNTSGNPIEYELSYTPSRADGTQTGKRTTLSIGGNEGKGLDDIVKAWYGAGILGEGGLGTLEIRPLGGANPLATFASSRTYAISAAGTLGQFIPAIALEKFSSSLPADKLSLQQIANSAAYRTNLGFVEGAGAAALMRVTLRDGANNVLKTVEKGLAPYSHEQTTLAAVFGEIPVTDGRVEVEVISGTGKATAYASVLDNKTNDPLLVFPVQAQKVFAQHYVVPGVAELENGVASNFHTDMRIYNASSSSVPITLNYFAQGNATPGVPAVQLVLAPGETKAIDNVLPSLWQLAGTGGAVTVDGPPSAQLVITARTYSRDAEGGTYGQFIPGVTAADGVGLNDRPLEVLQLEQSEQYRTNLGLVEVTGNPVIVEISGQSGTKATAVTQVTLNGNEFRQLGRVFTALGFQNVYTARVSVKVVGGTGRVAAYGSVVDNRTVDPTYVPAQ